jgi:hypothetical protein
VFRFEIISLVILSFIHFECEAESFTIIIFISWRSLLSKKEPNSSRFKIGWFMCSFALGRLWWNITSLMISMIQPLSSLCLNITLNSSKIPFKYM